MPWALSVSVIVGLIGGLILGGVAAGTLDKRIKRGCGPTLSGTNRIILLAGLAALAPFIPVVSAGVLAMVFVWRGPWASALKLSVE